jgi:small conductance mechanosensitive channel
MEFDEIFWKNTLSQAGIVILMLVVTVLLAKLAQKAMSKKDHLFAIDSTQYKFLTHLVSGLIYIVGFLGAIYSIPAMKGLVTTLLAGSGVLAIVLGFASQQAFGNIVSGIFIAIYKPFRIGDRIKFVGKDFIGLVEDITMRHTVIKTFDNKRIIVPNSVISSEILENANIVDTKILKFFEMGISYDSDIDKAMAIIKEEALLHSNFLDNRSDEEKEKGEESVKVRLLRFDESSVVLRANIWAKDPSAAFNLECDLNKSVKRRFDEEGIEIPFPYRTIVYKEAKVPEQDEKQ